MKFNQRLNPVSTYKIRIASLLLILLAISFLLRLTPLIKSYWVNILTALFVSNGLSIIIIAALLIALQYVEGRRYEEKLKKEEEK